MRIYDSWHCPHDWCVARRKPPLHDDRAAFGLINEVRSIENSTKTKNGANRRVDMSETASCTEEAEQHQRCNCQRHCTEKVKMSMWQGRVSESSCKFAVRLETSFDVARSSSPAVRKFSSTCRFLAFSSKQESLRRRRLDSAPHPILLCGRSVKRMPFRQRHGSNNRGERRRKCSRFSLKNPAQRCPRSQ